MSNFFPKQRIAQEENLQEKLQEKSSGRKVLLFSANIHRMRFFGKIFRAPPNR